MKKVLAALGMLALLVGCDLSDDDTGTTTTTAAATPALGVETCADGNDEDGDGKIDCADPDCAGYVSCASSSGTSGTSGSSGTTTGKVVFDFEGVFASLETTGDPAKPETLKDFFLLKGWVRNTGTKEGTVTVGLRVWAGDIALVSSATVEPDVKTLGPGLRSWFAYSTPTDGHTIATWMYWANYSGSPKTEHFLNYPPPPPIAGQ